MRLSDHAYLTGLLADAHADPALLSTARRTQAVRYRPGQRHVLRVSAGTELDHEAAYLKIDRDDHGARAVRFAQAVGPLLAERSPRARLVEPLGYGAEDRVAIWRGLAGTAMSQEIRNPARASPLLAAIGEAVRVLHDLDDQTTVNALTAEQRSAPHSARTELASVLGAGQYLSALLPDLSDRYRLLAMEVVERLEDSALGGAPAGAWRPQVRQHPGRRGSGAPARSRPNRPGGAGHGPGQVPRRSGVVGAAPRR